MKAYLIFSSKLPKEIPLTIENELSNQGHKVSKRDHPQSSENTYDFDEAKRVFQQNVKNIKTADIVIAECSYGSSGLGYEISLALEEKKPVIALYNLTIDMENPLHIDKVPSTFKGNTSKYILLRQYDIENLKKVVDLAIEDAKALSDTKFILIISKEIDRYLEWNARERGAAKAEVTREAIIRSMKEDKKYQEYLKSNDLLS